MKRFHSMPSLGLPLLVLMMIAGTMQISNAQSLAQEWFKGVAKTDARIQRLVLIGQLCGKLTDEDAQDILSNSRSELEAARARLSDKEQEWAKAWQEGVFIGATQSADIPDAVFDAGCAHFARPGGPLTAIMTWTGKPQTEKGVRTSPRTLP